MRTLPKLVLGMGLVFAAFALFPSVFGATNSTSVTTVTSTVSSGIPGSFGKLLGAGIAFGLAAFGAGIGLGQAGAAAIAAVTEKPEVRTSALIFVVLVEAIAIYGFVMAFIFFGQSV
jgi:V/A-type H+/Na+-transporting ATPase subunit K